MAIKRGDKVTASQSEKLSHMTSRLAVFAPFSNVWDHAYPEALLAEGLRAHEWEIDYLTCDGAFKSHCVAMSASGVGDGAPQKTKDQVCRACHKRRDLLTKEFEFSATQVEQWLTVDDARVIELLVGDANNQTWTSIEVDGVPLGRYAAYEMWLNNKLVDQDFSSSMWAVYLGQLRNTLTSFFAARRYFEERQPRAAIVYNDHYSVNHAFVAAGKAAGVPTYTIHGGWHIVRRGESLSVMKSDYTMANVFQSPGWLAYREKPLTEETVNLVAEHFQGLWDASSAFAYSSAMEGTGADALRAKFGVEPRRKVLLAPLSSEDEILGVKLIGRAPQGGEGDDLFADQMSWLRAIIDYAERHQEVHLIVRLHPRMFPNKRESVLSPVVQQVEDFRNSAPMNVTFNVPSDNVALYDLAQIVDVLLNYKSSVGAELLAMGIPVVTPANSDFYTYPNELNRVGRSVQEFEELIAQAQIDGWSIENSRKAFRWFGFLFSRVSVGFSETISSRPTAIRPKKPGLRLFLWKKFVYAVIQYGPLVRERLALRRRALAPTAIELVNDVLMSGMDTVSDSSLWPSTFATIESESAAIQGYFASLVAGPWQNVVEQNSLAGRMRESLASGSFKSL